MITAQLALELRRHMPHHKLAIYAWLNVRTGRVYVGKGQLRARAISSHINWFRRMRACGSGACTHASNRHEREIANGRASRPGFCRTRAIRNSTTGAWSFSNTAPISTNQRC
jgi:hypothetical protein